MGVPGLLRMLESITTREHLRDYRDMIVGIDASSWLYQAAYSCSSELAQGIKTDKYVKGFMKRVELLQSNGVVPVIVFDGAPLPIKGNKNQERSEKRRHNKELGLAALAAGDTRVARNYFNQALRVTPEMAHEVTQALGAAGVKWLVAPYEADAQLAHLARAGLVDAVVTEDADALAYGCAKVLFKMDGNGHVQVIERRNFGANKGMSLLNWTHEMFLDMCLLIGCDYLPSLTGIGVKTAHKLVKHHKRTDKILASLTKSSYYMPDNYAELFWKAKLTFLHQRIYDPMKREMTFLNQKDFIPVEGIECYDFLGPPIEHSLLIQVVTGRLHPKKLTPFGLANRQEQQPKEHLPTSTRSESLQHGNMSHPTAQSICHPQAPMDPHLQLEHLSNCHKQENQAAKDSFGIHVRRPNMKSLLTRGVRDDEKYYHPISGLSDFDAQERQEEKKSSLLHTQNEWSLPSVVDGEATSFPGGRSVTGTHPEESLVLPADPVRLKGPPPWSDKEPSTLDKLSFDLSPSGKSLTSVRGGNHNNMFSFFSKQTNGSVTNSENPSNAVEDPFEGPYVGNKQQRKGGSIASNLETLYRRRKKKRKRAVGGGHDCVEDDVSSISSFLEKLSQRREDYGFIRSSATHRTLKGDPTAVSSTIPLDSAATNSSHKVDRAESSSLCKEVVSQHLLPSKGLHINHSLGDNINSIAADQQEGQPFLEEELPHSHLTGQYGETGNDLENSDTILDPFGFGAPGKQLESKSDGSYSSDMHHGDASPVQYSSVLEKLLLPESGTIPISRSTQHRLKNSQTTSNTVGGGLKRFQVKYLNVENQDQDGKYGDRRKGEEYWDLKLGKMVGLR